MSRRRGEFEHRTSIFEGAYRAWSHLGGLDPNDIIDKTAEELNPLTNPLVFEDDKRWLQTDSLDDPIDVVHPKQDSPVDPSDDVTDPFLQKQDVPIGGTVLNNENQEEVEENDKNDGKNQHHTETKDNAVPRKKFYYEPLPRQGLSHPFVQAILLPWLGTDPSSDAVEVGLSTLRTWWQHRRKGESTSAMKALNSDHMCKVVDNYTSHFFKLAHFLIVNDGESPPRSLISKWKKVSSSRKRVYKKQHKHGMETVSELQKHVSNVSNLQTTNLSMSSSCCGTTPTVSNDHDGKKIPTVVPECNITTQRTHQNNSQVAQSSLSSHVDFVVSKVNSKDFNTVTDTSQIMKRSRVETVVPTSSDYMDDDDKTPVVFVTEMGDVLIAMTVEGMTYLHCVNIVETVLRGRDRKEGRKPPIAGIIDAVADLQLASVLIKINRSSQAKRIALEAARNLSLVGYTARPIAMSIVSLHGKAMDFAMLNAAFDVVANTEKTSFFNWDLPCVCMSNIYARARCERHKQMSQQIIDAFKRREKQVEDFMAGCAKKHGLPCNCGAKCRCKGCDCQAKLYHLPVCQQQQSVMNPPQQFRPSFQNYNTMVDPISMQSCSFMMQQQMALQNAVSFHHQQQQPNMIFPPQLSLNPFQIYPQNVPGASFYHGLQSWQAGPPSKSSSTETKDGFPTSHPLEQQSASIAQLQQPFMNGHQPFVQQIQQHYSVSPFLPSKNLPSFPGNGFNNPSISASPASTTKVEAAELEDLSTATPHSSILSSDAATLVEFADTVYNYDCQTSKAARNASLVSNISGLTSLDWDNIPGFDVNLDYSEDIGSGDAARRSSLHSLPESQRVLKGILRRSSILARNEENDHSNTLQL